MNKELEKYYGKLIREIGREKMEKGKREKLEEWWNEHCEGTWAPIKQARKARVGERQVIIVDMSEIRILDTIELAEMGLSLLRPPGKTDIGYIY